MLLLHRAVYVAASAWLLSTSNTFLNDKMASSYLPVFSSARPRPWWDLVFLGSCLMAESKHLMESANLPR